MLLFAILYSCKSSYHIDMKYAKAIDYLHRETDIIPFHVVDTLVYVSQINRFKSNSDMKQDLTFIDSLDRMDLKYRFNDTYYFFKQGSKAGKYNVYFSKPIENELFVEVVNNKGKITYPHDYLTSFNSTYIYLFLFNEKNEILSVTRHENINN